MFDVHLSSGAEKEIKQLEDRARIDTVLKALCLDPVPAKQFDVKKLRGLSDTFRIRIGKIRIVYTVVWKDKVIIVSRVSQRETAYD